MRPTKAKPEPITISTITTFSPPRKLPREYVETVERKRFITISLITGEVSQPQQLEDPGEER